MPLDPTLSLAVAVRVANAFCKRNPYLDRDEAHGQALLELVTLARDYLPEQDPRKNPVSSAGAHPRVRTVQPC